MEKIITAPGKKKWKKMWRSFFFTKPLWNRKKLGLKASEIYCTPTFDSLGEDDSSGTIKLKEDAESCNSQDKCYEKLAPVPDVKSSDIPDQQGIVNVLLEENDVKISAAGETSYISSKSNTSQNSTSSTLFDKKNQISDVETEYNSNGSGKREQLEGGNATSSISGENPSTSSQSSIITLKFGDEDNQVSSHNNLDAKHNSYLVDEENQITEHKHVETECNSSGSVQREQLEGNNVTGDKYPTSTQSNIDQKSTSSTTLKHKSADDEHNSYEHYKGYERPENKKLITSGVNDKNSPSNATANDTIGGKESFEKTLKKPKFKISTLMKAVQRLFNMQNEVKKDEQIDMHIGLRLALPDKIDIMRGVAAVENVKMNPHNPNAVLSPFPVVDKKYMILPEDSNTSKIRNLCRVSKTTIKVPTLKKKKTSNDKDSCLQNSCEVENSNTAKEIMLRTSEHEPSIHQITIPSAMDLLLHARVCALMESHDHLLQCRTKACKRWFNFAELAGLTRPELENLYLITVGNTPPRVPPCVGQDVDPGPEPLPNKAQNPLDVDSSSGRSPKVRANSFLDFSLDPVKVDSLQSKNKMKNFTQQEAGKPDRKILKLLLECSDDIIVEDYFTETIDEENKTTGVQVVLFSSQRKRQLIVCYRGSMSQHEKPVKSNVSEFVTTSEFAMNSTIHNTYFESRLEERVFKRMDKLLSNNPFCDVIYTGHSFGGCLSLLGSSRCAAKYPMMTVSCNIFGSPKIGDVRFRNFVHSLPNLRVNRVDYGHDIYTDRPLANPNFTWNHTGHLIRISSVKLKYYHDTFSRTPSTLAYKFGKKPVKSSKSFKKALKKPVKSSKSFKKAFKKNGPKPRFMKKAQGKLDHEMKSYLHSMEHIVRQQLPWVSAFVGEEGDGVRSADNEERIMV